ncbi:MAG: hypothetical protein EOP45_15840, partial [Sphingobacteriaceae bacterium]
MELSKQKRESIYSQLTDILREDIMNGSEGFYSSSNIINNYLDTRDHSEIAGLITKSKYRKMRGELGEKREEMRNVEQGYERIGYGGEKHYKPEQNLEKTCLRVPAAINSSDQRLIYGGVRIIPRIKTIETRDPEHTRIMNRGFGNLNSTTSLSSDMIARMRTAQGVNNSVSGINNPSYRERAAAADRIRES